MSDTMASLNRKIHSAEDLKSVVRTMKALAASSIGQYEKSVSALVDYYRTIELGIGACLRENGSPLVEENQSVQKQDTAIGVIVFGSDQGLVGQFNEILAEYVIATLDGSTEDVDVWVVGERIQARLLDAALPPIEHFDVPRSVEAIPSLVTQIMVKSDALQNSANYSRVYVFHNRPQSGSLYKPVSFKLLPLDQSWQQGLSEVPWPTKNLPEVMSGAAHTIPFLIREYFFIVLFRASVESLASENASRLAAMQRAEKNIDELIGDLNRGFHHLRQSSIDEELFDVISGFDALQDEKKGYTEDNLTVGRLF